MKYKWLNNCLYIIGSNHIIKLDTKKLKRTILYNVPDEIKSIKQIDKQFANQVQNMFWKAKEWIWEYKNKSYTTCPFSISNYTKTSGHLVRYEEMVFFKGGLYGIKDERLYSNVICIINPKTMKSFYVSVNNVKGTKPMINYKNYDK